MYRDLTIWQKSMDLVEEIYKLSEEFPKSEEYNLKSQIRHAVVSVTLNIAEGKCRTSSKDFAHFLNLSCASLMEVNVVLEIAQRLKYIKEFSSAEENISVLNKMINALRSKLINEKQRK